MPASTMIVCDECGDTIEAAPGTPHNALYVNYSHPMHGGAGMYYCADRVKGCADKILMALTGAPAQEKIQPPAAQEPAPEPAPEPTPSES